MPRSRRVLTPCALCLLLVLPCSAQAEDPGDPRQRVLEAMQTELARSMQGLRAESFERPYFMAYVLRDTRSVLLAGKYGALDTDDRQHYRQAYVEVRVGDERFDNFSPIDGESTRRSDLPTSYTAPLDDDPLALRQTFWLLSDALYKDAMSAYLAKQGSRIFLPEERVEVPAFSEAPVIEHKDPAVELELDTSAWSEQVRTLTRDLSRPDVLDAQMRVTAEHETRYLITSEGTALITEARLYGVFLSVSARADDGALVTHERTFYARSVAGLPSPERLAAEATQLLVELDALRSAPVLDTYTGPALLASAASGVLFHEAVGHRLEGDRMLLDDAGLTFRGERGRLVLPELLQITDDPTLERYDGHELNGTYRFDDEGVAAERVSLVEAGHLKDVLLCRSPVARKDRSNGHGRASGNYKPMARMSNFIVEAAPKQPQHDEDTLKAMLLEEVRKAGLPFGLYIKDIQGGIDTAARGHHTFSGTPRLVYRIDAATGEETLVRGLEVVGSPFAAITRTLAIGDSPEVFNGYCGAESGYLPVSTIAPAVLVSEIELRRAKGARERETLLPPPSAIEE